MATSNNNVKNVKFLRDGNLFGTREAAVSALTVFQLDANSDGTLILARYGSGSRC